jgi:hypothetical protein
LLDDGQLMVRRAAAAAIASLGTDGVEVLVEAVERGGRAGSAAAWALIEAQPVLVSRLGVAP